MASSTGASVVTAAVNYGDRGMSMLARWPADHPDQAKRGKLVNREKICPGWKGSECGRVYEQQGISREWLASLSESERATFLEACEVMPNGNAYLTKRCASCQRNGAP